MVKKDLTLQCKFPLPQICIMNNALPFKILKYIAQQTPVIDWNAALCCTDQDEDRLAEPKVGLVFILPSPGLGLGLLWWNKKPTSFSNGLM